MALAGLLSLCLYLGSALSQTTVTSYVAVDPTSTDYQGATHTIAVGKGGHTFIPDITQASVGDIIEFDFYPLNHSVVRAEYGIPCVPYEMTGPKVGFFSGFMPVDAILSNPPKWTVRINDTDPIFYYCSALGSCLDHEMVGVINPNASTSLATQKELASNSTFMLQPGEPWPAEATSSAIPTTATAAPTIIPSSPTSAPAETSSTAAAPASSNHSSLSSGAIAGIAIGGAAVLLAAGFLIWYCGRNSRRNQPAPDAPPTYVPPQYTTYPPMSPSAKHISGATTSPMYPSYPYTEHPNMGPFGSVAAPSPQQQAFYAPQPSPGHAQTSPLMGAQPQRNIVEGTSMRAGSPSPPPAAGIEAFLLRSGRMSPSTEGQSEDAVRNSFPTPNLSGSGPYEMSGSNLLPHGHR